MRVATKRRLVNGFEKHLQNPVIRTCLRVGIPLPPPWGALLETTGNKTGKLRCNPVIRSLVGEQFWIIAEHGHKNDYVRNLKANPVVRVKIGRTWRTGRATVLDGDDCKARARWLARELGGWARLDPLAAIFWTEPVTVRVDLEDIPLAA